MEAIDRSAEVRKMVDAMTKGAVDAGKLIESGWIAMFYLTLQGANEIQIREMRKAFFLGAQHLYGSIMSFLEEGQEATDKDMDRLTQVHEELLAFMKQYKEDHTQ